MPLTRIALPVRPATLARWVPTLAGLALCIALSGCGSPSAPGSKGGADSSLARLKSIATKRASSARAAKKPATPGDADFVAAVAGEKSAVPVEVRFELRARPEVGKPVELDVEVTPTAPLGRLVTSFHAEDGLTIEQGGAASATDRPTPNVPLPRALTIVAGRNGIFYVRATVLVDLGAESVARTFTIPVIAGSGAS